MKIQSSSKTLKQKNKNKKSRKNIKNKTKNIYIDGPYTMYYYQTLPDNRKLLIFGENHFTPNPCNKKKKGIHIVDYLKEIADNAEECIDIYIEEFYKTKEFSRYNLNEEYSSLINGMSYYINLAKLRKEFRSCDDRNKFFCKYKNARIHFSDPRMIYTTNIIHSSNSIDKYIENVMNGSIITTPELYLMNTNFSTSCYQLPQNYHKFKEVVKFLIGWKRDEKYKNYYCDYISYISGGYSFDIIINNWSEEYFKIIDKEKKKIQNFSVEKIYKTLCKIYQNYYTNFTRPLFFITLCIPMDVYFIFRYLMNFKKSKMNRGPIGCRDTNYSKNAIMYCGAAHAETYKLFINDFFNVEPDINIEQVDGNIINSCLELPEGFNFLNNISV